MDVLIQAGVRAHVVDRGTGPPALFLHGNPDTSEVWDGVIEAMRHRHRCLAPDLPGYGRSQAPAGFDGSLPALAAWVDGVVAAVSPALPLDLVVHDFGGPFGFAWASAHPEKVRRIGILNTAFFPDYRWHFWARVWRTPLLGELSLLLATPFAMAIEMRRGSKRLPATHARKAFHNLTPSTKRMMLTLYRAASPARFAPWQDPFRALMSSREAIVLWGDRDPYIATPFAGRFAAAQVHHFPHAGHWLQVEEPAAVAARLLEFFA
jgi:pimeloyl-ACP methyl ester carboxylesterase